VPGLLARYDALIASEQLQPDPDQRAAAERLAQLQDELEAPPPKKGLFARLTGAAGPELAPRGVYLWGGVGRGKSMLMDLAFDHIDLAPKRRVHFHAFMLETHGRLRDARTSEQGDPIDEVAGIIAAEARMLAFDVKQRGDERGQTVVVTESNLRGRHSVVFIHNRQDAQLKKAVHRLLSIAARNLVFEVTSREQYLPRSDSVAGKRFLVSINKDVLADGRSRLLRGEVGGSVAQPKTRESRCDGSRRNEHYLGATRVSRCQGIHQILDAMSVLTTD
jgi:hypothetical protein